MENFNVAYCGLYCGECAKFKKGKCEGCQKNDKATWCEVRKCCRENGYTTCADCTIFANIKDCKKHNNRISKVIGFFTNTDRGKCVVRIREIGVENFSKEMSLLRRQSMKK